MSKTRKKPKKLSDEEIRFTLWLKKQVMMSGRVEQAERRMDGVETVVQEMRDDIRTILEHIRPHPSHIPPEVLNPNRDAPLPPESVSR